MFLRACAIALCWPACRHAAHCPVLLQSMKGCYTCAYPLTVRDALERGVCVCVCVVCVRTGVKCVGSRTSPSTFDL